MTGRNMILQDLLAMCRTKAQAASEGHIRSIDLLHEALAGTLELFNALIAEIDPADATSRLCQEHGVRIDGRTKNRFIPLLKLVFGITYERSNISRNGSALKYAADRDITPDDLASFFKRNGGIARCAALETKERRLAALESRRMDAPTLTLPQDIALPSDGFLSLLVERGPDGEYRLLGTNVETNRSVRRYLASELGTNARS